MKQLLPLLLLLPLALPAQGPLDGYLKGKGVLDLAPSLSFNNARDFVGAENVRYDEAFRGNTLSVFAAYGLTKKIDLVGTAAYVFTNAQKGLQDGGLYLKYRPVYKDLGKNGGKLGLLLGAGASFPLSDYEPLAAGALGQRALSIPGRLIVQWESPLGLFLNLTGGYAPRADKLKEADIAGVRRFRPTYMPERPAGHSTVLLKVGFPAKHFYTDAWVEWQKSVGGSDYVPNLPDLPQAYGVSYTQVGGVLYYSENGKSGFLLSGGYILSGRNVSRILRLTIGAVIKFT